MNHIDLSKYFEQYENGVTEVGRVTPEDAEDSLRALKYWREEQRSVEEHAKKQTAIIELWKKGELERLKKRTAYHESVLKKYAVILGKKTVSLIGGVIKRRAGRDRVVITDEEKLLAWAKSNDLSVTRTKVEPDKKALMAYIKDTGEVPDGVDVETSEDSWGFDTK